MEVKTSKTLELSKKAALAGLTFNMPHTSPKRPSGLIQQKRLPSGSTHPKGDSDRPGLKEKRTEVDTCFSTTAAGTYPNILKHFHSILHETVCGTLSCRERARPCQMFSPAKPTSTVRSAEARASERVSSGQLHVKPTLPSFKGKKRREE